MGGRTAEANAWQVTHTERDQDTWRRFHRAFFDTVSRHEGRLHPVYREHMPILSSWSDRIPSLGEIGSLLAPFGWKARYVDGYAPTWQVAQLLARRIMPVSRLVRPSDEIFFAREPDLIHDIFGHLPSLMHPDYRQLLHLWASATASQPVTTSDHSQYHLNKLLVESLIGPDNGAFQCLEKATEQFATFMRKRPTSLYLCDKLYFWIFEFGMTEMHEMRQIFGAGIVSSLAEFEKIASNRVATYPLTPFTFLDRYNISDQQSTYLVAPTFHDYQGLLTQLLSQRAAMGRRIARSSETLHA